MQLRPYQKNTISELYDYLRTEKKTKNPCLVLPTGSGKSIVIAKVAKHFHKAGKGRFLMLTHVSELIEQNYEKVCQFVDKSDVGIYSSGLKRREKDRKITFAGIQSIANKRTPDFGVIMVDEAHLINTKVEGNYRKFLAKHPEAVVIGLTATPYRMNNGYINEGDESLFDDLIYPDGTNIAELIKDGYLSRLKSKGSEIGFSMKGVKKTNGDFNKKQMNEVLNKQKDIENCVKEIIERTQDYKHVIVFCAGIEHTENVAFEFSKNGETSGFVHGKCKDRDAIIDAFKKGFIKFLTNPNILTTGFDFPDIDCVVMLRPTHSTALYVQMVGRGMRLKSHTDHCMVLDYVGNIERHGSLLDLNVRGKTEAMKRCPNCMEIIKSTCSQCPECDFEFVKNEDNPKDKKPKKAKEDDGVYDLRDDDIMADPNAPKTYNVSGWKWKTYQKADGQEGVIVEFYGKNEKPAKLVDFYAIQNERAKYPCKKKIEKIAKKIYHLYIDNFNLKSALWGMIERQECTNFMETMSGLPFPRQITYRKNGKYIDILEYEFDGVVA